MKKSILTIILLGSLSFLHAQTTEFDALNLSQRDINGTARYMGMAGAFGALGGDVSAIKDNPAGLGVFRRSELTATFNLQNQLTDSKWLDGAKVKDDLFRMGFNNFSYVMSFQTRAGRSGYKGLLQSNFGFSYNRLKNFNRNVTVKSNGLGSSVTDFIGDFTTSNDALPQDFNAGLDNLFNDRTYLSWLSVIAQQKNLIYFVQDGENKYWRSSLGNNEITSPSYFLRESGYIDEYSFSWGGNISNIVYLGAAVNLSTVQYSRSTEYNERYSATSDLDMSSYFKTFGSGFNFNIGVIVRPINQLRLGLSYLTPTFYTLEDNIIDAHINYLYAPNTFYEYDLRIPGKLTASAAYVIGQKAIISTDFGYVNYKRTKLYGASGKSDEYEYENNIMKQQAKGGLTFEVGAEYRITNNFSLRAGFAAETIMMDEDMIKYPMLNTVRTDTDYFIHDGTNYFTFGAGYSNNFWNFDLAFVNKNLHQKFAPYTNINNSLANVTTRNYDIIATIGLRF